MMLMVHAIKNTLFQIELKRQMIQPRFEERVMNNNRGQECKISRAQLSTGPTAHTAHHYCTLSPKCKYSCLFLCRFKGYPTHNSYFHRISTFIWRMSNFKLSKLHLQNEFLFLWNRNCVHSPILDALSID